MSIPKVLGAIFLIEKLWWLLLNYFWYQKEFLKKKGSGEISFALISLFNIQIQEPTRSSTTTRAFVFPAKFHYHKTFETRN